VFFSRKRLIIFAFFSTEVNVTAVIVKGAFFIAAKHNSVQENEIGVFLPRILASRRKKT